MGRCNARSAVRFAYRRFTVEQLPLLSHKPLMRRTISSLSLTAAVLLLTACVAPKTAAPPSAPPPVPPPAAPVSTPLGSDWRNWPVTPGTWSYRQDERGSIALYGLSGSNALLTVRCDKARRRIYLSRAGSVGSNGGQIRVRTSFGDVAWAAVDTGGIPPFAAADIDPRDMGLDHMAFSRGRFAVEMIGQTALSVPAWPEFSRVLEDCR